MKSLILTSLYLIKDTIFRWKERPSSPLSRVLVVYFLSLSALAILATYVISSRVLREKIRVNGADTLLVWDMEEDSKPSKLPMLLHDLPAHENISILAISDSHVGSAMINSKMVSVAEYPPFGVSAYTDIPLHDHHIVLLVPHDQQLILPGPNQAHISGYILSVYATFFPPNSPLEKLYPQGVLLIPEDSIAKENQSNAMMSSVRRSYLIRVHDMTYENITRVEAALNALFKFDSSRGMVYGQARFLKELDLMLGNQTDARAGFVIGISFIVGILLTALASMEFRQNEYIYTLMKSFGVRPIMLVLTFIAENILLVASAFTGAFYTLLYCQDVALGELFKMQNFLLTPQDIQDDTLLLSATLLICVLISAIPIAASAYREIGRVLK